MYQSLIHYSLHLIVPIGIALLINKKQWLKISLIFWLSMLVDLDHLLANPIFDSSRCSINYHPLHTYWAIGLYSIMLIIPKQTIKIIGLALLFHMLTDSIDCFLSYRGCLDCEVDENLEKVFKWLLN